MLAPVLVTPPDCLAVLFHSVDVNDRLIATISRARFSNSSELRNFFRFDLESILHSLKVLCLLRTFYSLQNLKRVSQTFQTITLLPSKFHRTSL